MNISYRKLHNSMVQKFYRKPFKHPFLRIRFCDIRDRTSVLSFQPIVENSHTQNLDDFTQTD